MVSKREWFEKGIGAGKKDGWMDIENTISETLESHATKDYMELVQSDISLWETTDHFNILYGSKMLGAAKGNIDLFQDLKSEFWEGYLTGRKEIGIDIYQKAKDLIKER